MLDIKQKYFLIFVGFLFLLFFFFRVYSGNYFLADSKEYLQTAELISSGEYIKIDSIKNYYQTELLSKRGLTYPLFLLSLSFLSIPTIAFLQIIISFFSVLLILNIFNKYGGKNSYIIIGLLILTPSVFIYTNLIMTEFLALFFILLIFRLLFDIQNRRNILYIQIILILLIFLKPAFYLFPVISFLFFIYLSIKDKKTYFSSLFPILAVILFINFNEKRTGYAHFSSMQNINLVNYNIYLHKSKVQGQKTADVWKENIESKTEMLGNFKEKNEYLNNIGKTYIKENFVSYSLFHFYGAVRGCLDPGRFDLGTFFKDENQPGTGFMTLLNKKSLKDTLKILSEQKNVWVLILLIPIFIGHLIKWFFASFFVLKERKHLKFKELYIMTLCLYSIFISGPVNTSRYMVIVQGVLIVFCALYIDKYLGNKIKKAH